MDVNLLLQCFSSTISHDAKVRSEAETLLKKFSKTPGFLGACLEILFFTEVPDSVKLSASLYFKNKVTYGWSGKTRNRNQLLDYTIEINEKPIVREMIIKVLVYCSTYSENCMRILQPAVAEIIAVDYPQNQWTNLLSASLDSLNSNNVHTARIGLICLTEIFRTYRWKENDDRQDLEHIIIKHFPILLNYVDTILLKNGADMENVLIGEMIKLILKIYKFVTYNDLPFILQRPESFIGWANFHVSIVQQGFSPDFFNSILDKNRKHNQWIKAKKWAFANLYRLFQRYASESLSKKFSYDEFKALYVKKFLPQFLELIFYQIELWRNGSVCLSEESIYYILEFIEQAIIQKATWPLISPHYPVILKHVIFPLLIPNEKTLQSFESDPHDYIYRNLEVWNDDYSPNLAAISLLTTSVRKRPNKTLKPTLQLVNEILLSNSGNTELMSLEHATKVESCLRIISSILDKLIDPYSPYVDEMEKFLQAFVFPLFKSNHGFLRARACEICSKLTGFQFKEAYSFEVVYDGVITCFNDDSAALSVSMLAALALRTFIGIPQFNQSLSSIAIPTTQRLLQLSNEFESDTISGVIQDFVESFPTQLEPFAVELMNNLVQQFLKIAIEFHEASNLNVDSLNATELPDESGKQLAALGILSTAISILLSFENSKEIIKSLEQFFYPAAEFILKNEIEDFYREVCEFIENSSFLMREISPISWKLLELIGECNEKENSMVSFYLEDFMLAIDNYFIYGKDELKKNSFYSSILFRIFEKATDNEDNGLDEIEVLSELSQKIALVLGENTPKKFLKAFLAKSVKDMSHKTQGSKQLLTVLNVILASLAYFPLETLRFLNVSGHLKPVFQFWVSDYIPNYTRLYDIKLSLIALFAMISKIPVEEFVILGLDPVIPKMGSLISNLLERFPVALNNLKNRRTECSTETLHNTQTSGSRDIEYVDHDDFDLQNAEYLEILQKETNGIKFVDNITTNFQEGVEDLDEDPTSGSVLDEVNIYAAFHNVFNTIQRTDSMKHQRIFGNLTAEEQGQLSRALML